jgi:succinate dehydrogenase / fumarate reductase cytochrome b subunit
VLEIVLLLGFLIHIYTSFVLTRKNATGRPKPYAGGSKTPGVSWFSKNMALTGTLLLVFLVLHIRTFWFEFKFGEVPKVYYTEIVGQGEQNEVELHDIAAGEATPDGVQAYKNYTIVAKEAFQNPLYVVFYLLAFTFLAFHLAHGFASAFQTLGLAHKKYTPLVNGLGLIISIGVPLGFATIAICMYLGNLS